jgi:hypothetical protein
MHSLESRGDELRGGPFAWVLPFVFVVLFLAISWTGLFVVVSDLIEQASHINLTTDAVHE